MPFNLVERQNRGADPIVNRVAMAKASNNNQLQIVFSEDVLARLGNPDRINAYVGNGPDTGTILLSPTEGTDGYKVYSPGATKSKARKIGISASVFGIRSSFGTTAVDFKFVEQGIVVTLPAFMRKPARATTSPAPVIETVAA